MDRNSGYARQSWLSSQIGKYTIPAEWWSRRAEYPWAAQFAEDGLVVLDLGCGAPHPFKEFLADICQTTYAMDLDPAIQEAARDGLVPIVHDLTLSWSMIPDNSLDRIFCISVIEHLPHTVIPHIFSEARRTLKPDGILVVTFDAPDIIPALFHDHVVRAGYEFVGDVDLSQSQDVLVQNEQAPGTVGPPGHTAVRRVFVAAVRPADVEAEVRHLPSMDEWREAQKWEDVWWKNPIYGAINSYYEEWKQWEVYRPRMGLEGDSWYSIDLHGRSVIDVGGGPVSMLLKCRNGGRRLVVDPLADTWPDWVHERYRLAGIEVKNGMGEELDETGFDEAWVYNVLQHVRDPAQLVRRAMRAAKVLRLFEWVDTPVSDGHIHTLTKEMLDQAIGQEGTTETIAWSAQLQSFSYYGAFECSTTAADVLSAVQAQVAINHEGSKHISVLHGYEGQYVLPLIEWLMSKGARHGAPAADVSSLLDLGTGWGTIMEVGLYFGMDVTGTDQVVLPVPRYPVHRVDILDIDALSKLDLQPADILVCTETLEHLAYNPVEAFRYIVDRVNPSWLYLSVPREWLKTEYPVEGKYDQMEVRPSGDEGAVGNPYVHRKAWPADELAEFARAVGFEPVFVRGSHAHHFLLATRRRETVEDEIKVEVHTPIVAPAKEGRPMRFHIPGLVHTVTTPDAPWNSCAYTQKVRKLCLMLHRLGHEVYHYGGEGAQVECTEHVQIISREERLQYYPDGENMGQQFGYNTSDALHNRFNLLTAEAIKARLEGGRNFLLCSWGWGHQPISAYLGDSPIIVVEPGIGYTDTFSSYRVFESSAWMHYVYGIERGIRQHRPASWNFHITRDGKTEEMELQIPDNDVTRAARGRSDFGPFYDAVIPNYFVPEEFRYQEEKEDWVLYLGRMIQQKGIELAVQATAAAGVKLVLAGQGGLTLDTGVTLQGDHIEFVGHAGPEKRADLMARAKAFICPTYYIGPFEGVAIEAMLSGTPVITTDYGAYQETVLHGHTGYRCHTLEQFVWAINNSGNISPATCRQWALDNYSVDRVGAMFQEYFEMVDRLRDTSGWPEPNPDRTQLDWLTKRLPEAR